MPGGYSRLRERGTRVVKTQLSMFVASLIALAIGAGSALASPPDSAGLPGASPVAQGRGVNQQSVSDGPIGADTSQASQAGEPSPAGGSAAAGPPPRNDSGEHAPTPATAPPPPPPPPPSTGPQEEAGSASEGGSQSASQDADTDQGAAASSGEGSPTTAPPGGDESEGNPGESTAPCSQPTDQSPPAGQNAGDDEANTCSTEGGATTPAPAEGSPGTPGPGSPNGSCPPPGVSSAGQPPAAAQNAADGETMTDCTTPGPTTTPGPAAGEPAPGSTTPAPAEPTPETPVDTGAPGAPAGTGAGSSTSAPSSTPAGAPPSHAAPSRPGRPHTTVRPRGQAQESSATAAVLPPTNETEREKLSPRRPAAVAVEPPVQQPHPIKRLDARHGRLSVPSGRLAARASITQKRAGPGIWGSDLLFWLLLTATLLAASALSALLWPTARASPASRGPSALGTRLRSTGLSRGHPGGDAPPAAESGAPSSDDGIRYREVSAGDGPENNRS